MRLMTIHRAKGLEFPVVFVADLGKEGREENGPLQISRDGRVGLRLASLGADAVRSETLDAVKAQQNEDDEAEERRIMYVALTRAREHLVLSGATDLEKRKEPEALTEPLRWMWRNLVPELPSDDARGVGVESYEGRDVRGALGAPGPGHARRAAAAGRPRAHAARARARADGRDAVAGAGNDGGPSRAAGGAAELLEPGELPPLRLPLLPGAGAAAARVRHRRPRGRAGGRAARAPAREPGPPAAGAARHAPRAAAHPARRRGADRAARPAGARGRRRRPARHGRALLGLGAARPAWRRRGGCGRSCRSASRSSPPTRAAAACSSTGSWTCTRWRTTAR